MGEVNENLRPGAGARLTVGGRCGGAPGQMAQWSAPGAYSQGRKTFFRYSAYSLGKIFSSTFSSSGEKILEET